MWKFTGIRTRKGGRLERIVTDYAAKRFLDTTVTDDGLSAAVLELWKFHDERKDPPRLNGVWIHVTEQQYPSQDLRHLIIGGQIFTLEKV